MVEQDLVFLSELCHTDPHAGIQRAMAMSEIFLRRGLVSEAARCAELAELAAGKL